MTVASVYPVRVDARLDPHLSRWLWLVKWVLTIPHYVVLLFLWIAFFVTSVVAFFAILFTGRYPRPIFDFNLGVMRWTWRVSYYSTTGLGTTGCLAFTRETLESGSGAHARFFAPADNIPEDPATGSACGALGAYLVNHNALKLKPEEGRYKFVIEQGDFINRPSRINLDVKGTAGKVEEVKVGGASVVVAKGEVFI